MARLVGFDQDPDSPDGTGLFHFDSGQSVLAHDPETAAQFQQPSPDIVAAAAPGPDQRLAANGNVDLGDIDAPATRQGVTTVENVQPPNQPAMAMADQGQPQQVPEPSANPYVGQEAAAANYINRPVVSAPTKGGFKPKSASETVESEHAPITQEDVDARRQLNDDYAFAHAATLKNQAQRAQNEATALKAQMPVLAGKEAATRAAADKIDQQYTQERARIKKMAEDFDPNHFYKEKGTGGTIALALAQGLGAFASIRSGGPNFAHQIVQDAVNRDIAAQKDKQGSALKNLEMMLGDKQQAEAAYRLIHDQNVAQKAAAFAADAKSQDATAAAREFLAENAKQQAKDEQAFRDAAWGKHKKTLEEAYQQGSAGGSRAPTEKEKQERIATLTGMNNVMKGQAETEKLRAENAGGGKETKDEARDLVKTEKDEVEAQASMGPLRKIVQKYKGEDIPGWGLVASHTPARMLGTESRQNQQTIELAIPQIAIAMYGRGAERNQQLLDTISSQMKGIRSSEDLENLLNNFDSVIAERRKSLRAGYSQSAVQRVDEAGSYQPDVLPQSAQRIGQ